MQSENELEKAMKGDINAFHSLFDVFKPELKSFLFRLLSDRNLVEDFYHDIFIKAFNKIKSYKGNSSFKTWCFSIASNLCLDYLRKQKRWSPENKENTKKIAESTPEIHQAFMKYVSTASNGEYEIREHIDFCFTCMAKTIEIEKQLSIILKDIYQFEVKEIAVILNYSTSNIKKLLLEGRKTLTTIFEKKCALVNKNGVCHQCSELNGVFNRKQNQKEELLKIKLVKEAEKGNKEDLYSLRTELVRNIDPLNSNGTNLHELLMDVAKYTAGEIKESPFFKLKIRIKK